MFDNIQYLIGKTLAGSKNPKICLLGLKMLKPFLKREKGNTAQKSKAFEYFIKGLSHKGKGQGAYILKEFAETRIQACRRIIRARLMPVLREMLNNDDYKDAADDVLSYVKSTKTFSKPSGLGANFSEVASDQNGNRLSGSSNYYKIKREVYYSDPTRVSFKPLSKWPKSNHG